MPRPKKNTPEGKKALEKWKATMLKKYGSEEAVKNKLREAGRKGGQNGHTGGFASRPELAKIAGAKGGSISRRGPSYNKEWEEHREEILKMRENGSSDVEISNKFNIPYSTLRARIKIYGGRSFYDND